MTNYEKLLAKLTEIFQLDQADLDFGIYRIMNSKRDEIVRFLEKDLLPQVKSVLATAQGDIGSAGAEELKQAEDQARSLGVDPNTVPKVQELRAKYAGGSDIGALEQEVFNHLYSFFRRYYDEGDFLSLRRYKEGVYAIPYEGEEVKLHWANADQYYIKTAEHFRDFIFKVGDKRVHFKLVEAQAERDNNKEQEKRVFILSEENPVVEEAGELIIRFEYRSDPAKRKQKELTEAAVETVFAVAPGAWRPLLATPVERDPNRTVLAKRLNDYTARNTFDYFIHKDLGGFLRRELDFYVKNEVMHLDDIENEAAPKVGQYLAKVRAIRRVACKIITFLAQLEEFQKALWLKKKFVIDTYYLISIDRIPESLYGDIARNESQVAEWVTRYGINQSRSDLLSVEFTEPPTVSFIKENANLIVDTRHFSRGFRNALLAALGSEAIDAALSGIVLRADNFHALSLVRRRFAGLVSSTYIDPPYNTGDDGFPYKDDYRSSSWLAMMGDRLRLAAPLLSPGGILTIQIGDDESAHTKMLVDASGLWRKNSVVVRRGVKNVQAQFKDIDRLSLGHDILHVCTLSKGSRMPHLRSKLDEEKDGKWDTFWRGTKRPTMRYELLGIHPTEGQWRWEEGRGKRAVRNYQAFLKHEAASKTLDEWYIENLQAGEDIDFVRLSDDGVVQYYVPPQAFKLVSDNWLDVSSAGTLTAFPHEKSIELLQRVIGWNTKESDWVLDFFAGSGSTGHACFAGEFRVAPRKFLMAESAGYVDEVLIPRLKQYAYAETWDEEKPVRSSPSSSCFIKVSSLESYEDVLSNLTFGARTTDQASLVESNTSVREDFLLRYVLEVDTAESPCKLSAKALEHPFDYSLRVAEDTVGETKEVNVDVVETFNWLLGLRVHTVDVIRGFQVVTGRLPGQGNSENGDKALIIWRDTTENPNAKLDDFFRKQAYNTLDQEFDVIYVNGDNNLQNLRKDDQTWKVRLIEEEFHRLMWDVEDV